MKFKPTLNRLLCREIKPKDRTDGGIIIPDSAKEKALEGIVVAAGPGLRSEKTGELLPMECKVGDHVLWEKHGGARDHNIGGEDFILVSESVVLAILEKGHDAS